jgi:two-component system C4-dicarboxylate transport response regulator DctD
MGDEQSIGVIYVEDDEDVRIGGVQALELAGFSVSGFASVETANDSVRAEMPFVVVCDVRLRGKSGLEWQSDLRRHGRAGDAKRCLRFHREAMLVGATRIRGPQGG